MVFLDKKKKEKSFERKDSSHTFRTIWALVIDLQKSPSVSRMVNARLHKSLFYCQTDPYPKIHLLLEDFFSPVLLFLPTKPLLDLIRILLQKVHFFMCLNSEVKMVVKEKRKF